MCDEDLWSSPVTRRERRNPTRSNNHLYLVKCTSAKSLAIRLLGTDFQRAQAVHFVFFVLVALNRDGCTSLFAGDPTNERRDTCNTKLFVRRLSLHKIPGNSKFLKSRYTMWLFFLRFSWKDRILMRWQWRTQEIDYIKWNIFSETYITILIIKIYWLNSI